MTVLSRMNRRIAWRLAGRGELITLSATHRSLLGSKYTICGDKIPEDGATFAQGGQECQKCASKMLRDKLGGKRRKPGRVTREEVQEAVRVFLAGGGVIVKLNPTPAVPLSDFEMLEV